MRDTEFYSALSRLTKGSYKGRAEYILKEILKFKEGTWINPNNRGGNDYTIFTELYEIGLVVKKVEPIWLKGSYMGNRIKFMYKNDLNYASSDLIT